MFAWWGRIVYRFRYIVIAVMVAMCALGGVLSLDLGKHVTQSGFFDEGSESVRASVLADEVYGRDRTSHVVGIISAPDGRKVDDPQWSKEVTDQLNAVKADHPDQFLEWYGYLRGFPAALATPDKDRAFVYITLKGDNDDVILNNYKAIEPDLQQVDGGNIKLAGLNPLANELTGTIAKDQKRMEIIALPLVAVVLFFVFGGVVAASLPVIIGGLSIIGSLGILRAVIWLTGEPMHYFAQPVVTLIGLGIAIDYGLFVVSRFREEIAEGYDTETAVRRTVQTAGRTVTFSAVLIVASLAGLLLFPQGFLKSLTYAGIASVSLSALLSITVLPAALAILGRNVDALGVRTLYRIPFLRDNQFTSRIIDWFAERTQKTKTRADVENGFWGQLVNRVMKRPVLYSVPILVIMVLLIVPLGQLALGGISEKYLPPDNPVRMAQEDFDRTFPGYRTEKLTLVIENASPTQVDEIKSEAAQISGFTEPQWSERPVSPDESGNTPQKTDPDVTVLQNGLEVRNDAAKRLDELRAIEPPRGVTISVGGTPALEQDSIHSLFDKLPMMLVILVSTTTLLMFLAFGSLVLPIKAAVMSALTLGSTLGILTWIFVEGHGSGVLNFTATPLTAPVVGLIIAVIYGLSTDYEVFLVSRMVEARARGLSTSEAIRVGTATTGRIITAAALILVVVGGAFVFSDLVMLKYLAVGLIAALLLDATVIRMFLVPAIMKMLGDDCWWAPRWMKRIQERLGLGEIELPDERKRPAAQEGRGALVGAEVAAPARPPRSHDPFPSPRPRATPRRIPPRAAGQPATRIPDREDTPEPEPPTTRIPAAGNTVLDAATSAVNAAGDATKRTARRTPPPPVEDRELDEPTTAIPTQPEEDPGVPQEPAPSADDDRRRGPGISAQDVLRREGRL
ncbi:MMPL family transporter [Mycobacterium manitobense]|uniref:MMPL family transporter n=1 Tax=[Mycobacterium] manitobense TaxID=190147 RepID=A0A9X2YRF7_9MYCO|nr:MMPL family transporter [[Mycobacterium] manitobense]MCV7172970.1 MMPL family transporter [[Mycobacterium] manitobense]